MKLNKDNLIILILICVIGFLSYKMYDMHNIYTKDIEQIHEVNKENGEYLVKHYDEKISKLKKTNKVLYDSIKNYKNEIDYLVQFKYQKEYITDTVYISIPAESNKPVCEFKYSNPVNDTLNYKLTIGSITEPCWYKLDVKVSDKFTIINKNNNGLNTSIIKPDYGGDISDVTVIKQDKSRFWDNFYIGPTINVGYDIVNQKLGVMMGVGVTYKFKFKKK